METKLKEISELRNNLRELDYHYWVLNSPLMSDEAYDALYRRLQKLEEDHPEYRDENSPTQKIGSPVEGFGKVNREVPMLSLENAFFPEDMDKYLKLWAPRELISVEPKVDGVSISLSYRDGRLVQASTRGNGSTGDDITSNARAISNVPLVLRDIPDLDVSGDIEIRGEAVIFRQDFERINLGKKQRQEKPFANARNLTAGTLKSHDPKQVRDRLVRVVAYDIVSDKVYGTSAAKLMELLGFSSVFRYGVHFCKPSLLQASLEQFRSGMGTLPFDVDGAVVKVVSAGKRSVLGHGSKYPKWAFAYKYSGEASATKLISVEWQVGRTGVVTPVANLEPVEISGTVVSRATLHNMNEIARKQIRINDRVFLRKAGEIIPEILGVESSPPDALEIVPPTRCPSCQAALREYEDRVGLYCTGPDCVVRRIQNVLFFGSKPALDIKSWGPKLAQALVEFFGIKYPEEVLHMEKEKLEQLAELPDFGELSVKTLLSELKATRNKPPHRVLVALGLPGIGEGTAKSLLKHFGSLENMLYAGEHTFGQVPLVGEKTSQQLAELFCRKDTGDRIRSLQQAGLRTKQASSDGEQKLKGYSVVITGTLSAPRDEVADRLEQAGAAVRGSVSSKTDLVLVGESPGASKVTKAQSLGIRTITEEDLERLLSE